MEQGSKVKAFQELYELINIYFDERDLPTQENFFEEFERCCKTLDIDYKELKKAFGIKRWDEIWKGNTNQSGNLVE